MERQLTLVKGPEKAPEKESDDGFNTFWSEYPRRVGKHDARKAWQRLRPDERLRGEIQSGLRNAVSHWQAQGTEKRFIPHASSWLNGRRWEDEYEDDGDPFEELT